jgi:hypothetical protein
MNSVHCFIKPQIQQGYNEDMGTGFKHMDGQNKINSQFLGNQNLSQKGINSI